MTIIAGLPVEYNDRFIRGIAVFAPWRKTPGNYHQSHGACLGRRSRTITVVDEQPQGMDMDPTCSLFTTGQCLGEPDLLASARRLQFFSHQYSIAVLMANARGNSALWDEYGRLIVRADRGSLLLVGQHRVGKAISFHYARLFRPGSCHVAHYRYRNLRFAGRDR